MDQLAEEIDGLPNISGSESRVEAAIAAGRGDRSSTRREAASME
jgi:hypothetical protein